jgi:hypothetical protein
MVEAQSSQYLVRARVGLLEQGILSYNTMCLELRHRYIDIHRRKHNTSNPLTPFSAVRVMCLFLFVCAENPKMLSGETTFCM